MPYEGKATPPIFDPSDRLTGVWQCEACARVGLSRPAGQILVISRTGPGLSRIVDGGSFCTAHADLAQGVTPLGWPDALREADQAACCDGRAERPAAHSRGS